MPNSLQYSLPTSAVIREHTRNLSEVSNVTGKVTDSNRVMFDTIHELDGGMSDLSGTMDATTGSIHGVDASMVALQHSIPQVSGEMRVLHSQFQAVTAAVETLGATS